MSREKGDHAEEAACGFLCEKGFQVIERNFYSRFGEIDIVAFKDNVFHFVEVKSGVDYESAIANITPKKLSKFVKTLHIYLKKNALRSDFTVDAVIVTPRDIRHVENITL